MPFSDYHQASDRSLSVLAPSLYLLNLLLLPGIAFLILCYMYMTRRDTSDAVTRIQIEQNFYASIVSGVAIIGVSVVILSVGGFSSIYGWMFMIIYAVSVHATFVLLGVLSLSKSLNHEAYIYPGLSRLSAKKSR